MIYLPLIAFGMYPLNQLLYLFPVKNSSMLFDLPLDHNIIEYAMNTIDGKCVQKRGYPFHSHIVLSRGQAVCVTQ